MSICHKISQQKLAQNELEWLFNHSNADMGIKSSYMAIINAGIYGGTSNWSDPYSDFIISSIGKKRKIDNIFYALSIPNQKVLFIVHSFIVVHPYVEKIFSNAYNQTKIGSVAYIIMDPDELEKIATKAILGTITASEKIKISQVKSKQIELYQNAINSYCKLRFKNEK